MADDSKLEWVNDVLKAWETIAFALEAWQAASRDELYSAENIGLRTLQTMLRTCSLAPSDGA